MKVLLTGFTGFIGQSLYKELLRHEIDLHVTSRFLQHSIKNAYVVDLLDHEATHAFVQKLKPDILVHLAWDVTHGEFWNSPKNILYADASIHLFQSFIENGGKKIISTGTCAEYPVSDKPMHEDIAVDQCTLTPYGREKRRVSEWLVNNNCDFTWLRIFGVYGDGEDPNKIFPEMVRSIKEKRDFVLKTPAAFFDYVNVGSIALFFKKCFKKNGLGIINMGTGKSHAIFDLYQAMKGYVNSGKFRINKTIEKPDNNSRIPDCIKLKNAGFEFRLNFELDHYLI